MKNRLLILAKKLNAFLQENENDSVALHFICEELKATVNANAVLLDEGGKAVATSMQEGECLAPLTSGNGDGEWIDNLMNQQMAGSRAIVENMALSHYYVSDIPEAILKKYTVTILPICNARERVGTMLLYRDTGKFLEDETAAAVYCAAIAGIIMRYLRKETDNTISRETAIVKSAIGTLSYSELEVIILIFREINGVEGLVVAGRIADKAGITRSVIVNALRKLESAGILESRSLGMKGTYIKVNNGLFIDELNKLIK